MKFIDRGHPWSSPERKATQESALNINQIKYFISAVDRGSFSAAASDHFITAQGVSKAVADLESEIGLALLIRKNRGVEPTDFGKKFYEQAKLAERCFDNLEQFARNYVQAPESSPTLTLQICTPSFIGMGRVSTNVAAFIRKNLGIGASVMFDSPERCLASLRDGSIDAAISIGRVHADGIECCPIGTIPCGVQMLSSNPLAARKQLLIADLHRSQIAFWQGFDFFNNTVQKSLADKGIAINPYPLKPELEDLISFFNQGGALFVPYISAIEEGISGSVVIPFEHGEGLTIPLCLVSSSSNQSPKVRTLRRFFTVTKRSISEPQASKILSKD